jgi:Tol biopolymer transport system component
VAFKASSRGWDDFYLADLDRKLRYNISDSEGDTVAIDLSQDGDTVAFVQRFGGAMGIFTADISSRKVANRSGVLGSVVDVIVSASGRRHAFLLGGLSPHIEVWDTKGKKETQVASVAEGCWEPAMSSDGLFVAALCAAGPRDAAMLRLFPLPEPE